MFSWSVLFIELVISIICSHEEGRGVLWAKMFLVLSVSCCSRLVFFRSAQRTSCVIIEEFILVFPFSSSTWTTSTWLFFLLLIWLIFVSSPVAGGWHCGQTQLLCHHEELCSAALIRRLDDPGVFTAWLHWYKPWIFTKQKQDVNSQQITNATRKITSKCYTVFSFILYVLKY